MTTIAVSAATGKLGRLVLADLLERGVSASDLVALARTPAKAADLAAQGVEVRAGDYAKPEELEVALKGVDVLLLISSDTVGIRLPQHTNVIRAAKAAGVGRVVYTSAPKADTSALSLVPEHKATEEVLRTSGLTFTILRNNWYTENYVDHLSQYLAQGAITGASGNGRVAVAARADYAAAAAAVLTSAGHDNAIYELAGVPTTMTELAETITGLTGTNVVYNDVPVATLIEILQGVGMDNEAAAFVASLDEGAARGDLDGDSGVLEQLIGRPLTPTADVVRSALQG